jgi:proteasome lid subunit RPN8/RPN11
VLRIEQAIHDQIVAHARRDHPDEACGVVAGAEDSDTPTRFVPMLNAARSPTFYEFDSADLLRIVDGVVTEEPVEVV